MKRTLTTLLAAVALTAAATPAPAPAHTNATALAAKRCSAGYTHAKLPWGHKCLRRGQFCKTSGDRHYHRYGYHCHTGRLR